jgi:phage-related protein
VEIIIEEILEEFIENLDTTSGSRVMHTIRLLKSMGNQLGMPHSKKINNRLFELRIIGKPSIRIFYEYKNRKAHLVHGFLKKSQKTPQREIDTAMKRLLN